MSNKMSRIYLVYYSNIFYIGSTKLSLVERFKKHKTDFNYWCKNKNSRGEVSIFKFYEKYGFENFNIELLEETTVENRYNCENKWISKFSCVNYNSALGFDKQKIKKTKTRFIKKLKQDSKRYNEYKEKHNKLNQKFMEKNKNKFQCLDCGYNTYRKSTFISHLSTIKHLNNTLPTHNFSSNVNSTRETYDKRMEYFTREWYGNMTKWQLKENRKSTIERYEKNNKENKKLYSEKYRIMNKKKINEYNSQRVNCPQCDIELNKASLTRHIKRKHS
jgi:hypothetical protein